MKERIHFIDTAKGVTLILVLFLHISNCYPGHPYTTSLARTVVSTFFMPVFFVLSGLFFSSRKEPLKWLNKKTKRLFVPYLFFYILTYILAFIMVKLLGIGTKNGFNYSDIFIVFRQDVFSNATIWFLLALFWASLVMYIIDRNIKPWWGKLIMVALCFMGGHFVRK